jgi:hypothetical protein
VVAAIERLEQTKIVERGRGTPGSQRTDRTDQRLPEVFQELVPRKLPLQAIHCGAAEGVARRRQDERRVRGEQAARIRGQDLLCDGCAGRRPARVHFEQGQPRPVFRSPIAQPLPLGEGDRLPIVIARLTQASLSACDAPRVFGIGVVRRRLRPPRVFARDPGLVTFDQRDRMQKSVDRRVVDLVAHGVGANDGRAIELAEA